MIKNKIYLDYAATTPVDDEVLDVMLKEYSSEAFFERHDEKYIENQMEKTKYRLLDAINAKNGDVIFTASGTEANNLAIRGHAFREKHRGKRLLVSGIEHPSVLNVFSTLESEGFEVVKLPVTPEGVIDLEATKAMVTIDTILVAVMFFNNEIGTRQPVEELGEFLHEKNIAFHVDAVQALGKTVIDVSRIKADTMTFSAHKIYGPKGCGALYTNQLREELKICLWDVDEVAIAGFGKAIEISKIKLSDHIEHLETLKFKLIDGLMRMDAGLRIIGEQVDSHPAIICVNFPTRDGDGLVIQYDFEGICVSSGSACSSGAISASHVLLAIGMDPVQANRCVRFSLGLPTTNDEIDRLIETTERILKG
jgi:cysteine desulfurase